MRTISRVIYRAYNNNSKKGVIGYIGCSKYGLEYRRDSHNKDALKKSKRAFMRAMKKYPKESWSWEILESGFKTDQEMKAAEKRWIREKQSRTHGYNETDGGDGLINPPERVRRIFSLRLKGVLPGLRKGFKLTDAQKEHLRIINTGKTTSPETRKKISKAGRGRKLSEETKEKIRIGAIGTRVGMLGKKHSAETIEKMRLSQAGNKSWMWGKHGWMHGRKHSEEVREKMRTAWIIRKERIAHEH